MFAETQLQYIVDAHELYGLIVSLTMDWHYSFHLSSSSFYYLHQRTIFKITETVGKILNVSTIRLFILKKIKKYTLQISLAR